MKQYSGWGRNQKSFSEIIGKFEFDLESLASSRGFLATGLHRSYGDASLNSGGILLDTQEFNSIEIDVNSGRAECGSGVVIRDLERESIKVGLFPYVVPGTAFVTIGGAIASDIHGKSHHVDGNFSDHLNEIEVMKSDGKISRFSNVDIEFAATVGGLGLTGVITSANFKLRSIETAYIKQKEVRCDNINELIEQMNTLNTLYTYTVAWIDLSSGKFGRGLAIGGNHAKKNELGKKQQKDPLKFKLAKTKYIPVRIPINIINNLTVRVFNKLWFSKPLKTNIVPIYRFMHPLDGISNWNLLYGNNGFVQYQFVLPDNKISAFSDVLALCARYKISSPMAVLKSLGKESIGYLGFSIKGWTLAIDIPSRHPNIDGFLRSMDELIVENNGRVYLTKDSRLDKCDLEKMYPRLKQWKNAKKKMDPEERLKSDLGRRLGLC